MKKKNSNDLHWTSQLWNDLCGDLPKVKYDKTRLKKINEMLKHFPDQETWTEVINNLVESEFCRGNNDRGWVANFDFLLQPKSFVKCLERAYNTKKQQNFSKNISSNIINSSFRTKNELTREDISIAKEKFPEIFEDQNLSKLEKIELILKKLGKWVEYE